MEKPGRPADLPRPEPRPAPKIVLSDARPPHETRSADPGSAERIYRISEHGSVRDHRRIERALRLAGVDTLQWVDRKPWLDLLARWADRDHERQFLEDIASLHDGDGAPPLSKVNRWSLRELADTVFATGYLESSISGFDSAFRHVDRELRVRWLECVALGNGIDIPSAAAQARFLLSQPPGELAQPHDWQTVTVRPSYPRAEIEPSALSGGSSAPSSMQWEPTPTG